MRLSIILVLLAALGLSLIAWVPVNQAPDSTKVGIQDSIFITVPVHLTDRAFPCRRPVAWPASSIVAIPDRAETRHRAPVHAIRYANLPRALRVIC